METDLNKLRDRAYKIAKEHGFHEKEQSDETYLMLIITEIAEAVNADRKGHHADIAFETEPVLGWKESFEKYVKDTVEDELADVVIRLLDFAGARKVNFGIQLYSSLMIGKNSNFCENCFEICRELTDRYFDDNDSLIKYVLGDIFSLAHFYSIDLFKFIDLKMKYNELRPYKNGKEY